MTRRADSEVKGRQREGGIQSIVRGRSGVRGQGRGTRVEKGVAKAEALSLSQVRRAPLSEEPHSLGCYNPVMEDAVSYAALRFPVGDNDTPRTGYRVRVPGWGHVNPGRAVGGTTRLVSCLPSLRQAHEPGSALGVLSGVRGVRNRKSSRKSLHLRPSTHPPSEMQGPWRQRDLLQTRTTPSLTLS